MTENENDDPAYELASLGEDLWVDLGPTLTCSEAETFATFLHAYGQRDSAAALLDAHAREDDEGDQHYQQERSNDDAD